MELIIHRLVAHYQAYYNKSPKIIIGKKMFVDFESPTIKSVVDKKQSMVLFGCELICGNFDFGFYLE